MKSTLYRLFWFICLLTVATAIYIRSTTDGETWLALPASIASMFLIYDALHVIFDKRKLK